jgi:hypothetical protein
MAAKMIWEAAHQSNELRRCRYLAGQAVAFKCKVNRAVTWWVSFLKRLRRNAAKRLAVAAACDHQRIPQELAVVRPALWLALSGEANLAARGSIAGGSWPSHSVA